MTASTTEAGLLAGETARVVVREGRISKEGNECQNRNGHRRDKCQDISGSKGHHYSGHTSSGEGHGGGGGASGGDDKTQYQHYHSDKTPQHHHQQDNHLYYQSHGDEDTYQLLPPDGGWGWMVALGTFIITMLLPMMVTCFSVLFSEYLLGAGSSSTTTAWIFNLQSFLFNISALLARPLTQEFGWRIVALTGSIMSAAGLMISAFTPSPSFLFFSFSLLTGLGGGVVTCQCFTILPHYFQRRRGLANGITMCGICMGQLLGPPVTRFLQYSYSFRGATLILGALALNACVGASFFHPFEWHQKMIPLEKPQEDTPAFPTTATVVNPTELTQSLVHSNPESPLPKGNEEDGIKRLLERREARKVSCSFSKQSSRYSSTLSLSSGMGSLAALPLEEYPEEEDQGEKERRDIIPVRVVRSLIRDLGSLKSLRVCILCVGDTMCITGYINFIMMVPFAMLEAGFPLDVSAWCISVSALVNMVTRFLVSSLSDWPRFNKRLVYMSGFAFIAFAIFAFTLVSSVDWLMVVMVVYGIGVGANMGIYNLVIIDVMGVEHLGPVFGTASFFLAVGAICFGPFVGFIRDVTQSYAASMCFTGGILMVALTSWLFMGLAERIDRHREEGKTLTEALQKT